MLNAGDGQHEHPTQALLDALALREALNDRGEPSEDFTGLTVAICGDIMHSRVARSNLLCLQALGATVRLCAPPALMPAGVEAIGAQVFHDFDAALGGCRCGDDAAAAERAHERAVHPLRARIPPPLRPDPEPGSMPPRPRRWSCIPGPMNRGVEIDSDVADLVDRSLITRQVEMGVAIRMACLDVLTRSARGIEGWAV